MPHRSNIRLFVILALVGVFLLVWSRLRIVLLVQLNLFNLLVIFAVLVIGIYAAVRLLFSR